MIRDCSEHSFKYSLLNLWGLCTCWSRLKENNVNTNVSIHDFINSLLDIQLTYEPGCFALRGIGEIVVLAASVTNSEQLLLTWCLGSVKNNVTHYTIHHAFRLTSDGSINFFKSTFATVLLPSTSVFVTRVELFDTPRRPICEVFEKFDISRIAFLLRLQHEGSWIKPKSFLTCHIHHPASHLLCEV